jgi:hypothetical protein
MANGGIVNLKGRGERRDNKAGLVSVFHQVTFTTNSDVSSQSSGTGVSFADGASGVNVVTFDHPYKELWGVRVTPVGSSGGQMFEVSTDWAQSTKTLSLRCLGDAGSAEDWAAITYRFEFIFKTTGA